ncbi:MAG: hypothetical protein WC779_04685 [Candidatus Omnitrophota bacterium]|jgi:hypothetical protein
MRRLLLIAAVLVFGASLSFAEEGKVSGGDYTMRAEGLESITGVVKLVQPAGLIRPNSVLIVTDETGRDLSITMRPSAAVYKGTDGKMVSLKELVAGQRVQVSYSAMGGTVLRGEAVKILQAKQAGSAAQQEARPTQQANAAETEEAVK